MAAITYDIIDAGNLTTHETFGCVLFDDGHLAGRRFYGVKWLSEHGRGHIVDADGQKVEKCRFADVVTGLCEVRDSDNAWVFVTRPAPLTWSPAVEEVAS